MQNVGFPEFLGVRRSRRKMIFCSSGCEGSVLLDDTKEFKGEKNAGPNHNSATGFEVIDYIKAELKKYCPSTLSCVDILTLAARDAVFQSGGPFWPVSLGRLDGFPAAEKSATNSRHHLSNL
ncbi:peroxidase 10-like [Primulina huaijiensis]|uniref:peroxidase 10-like n=1 Tax=Primulina huaijiensis TaxID=1492673 RepID=UPI003CC7439A